MFSLGSISRRFFAVLAVMPFGWTPCRKLGANKSFRKESRISSENDLSCRYASVRSGRAMSLLSGSRIVWTAH